MKNLKFLFLAFTLVVMTSCSSDEDDSTPANNVSGELLGTWIGVTVDYTGTTTTEILGQSITVESVGRGYDVDYTVTFAEPNVLTAVGSYSVELTTTTLGQTEVQNIEDLEFASDGTWSRDGNELLFMTNGNSETQTNTITELTATTMTLVSTETTTVVESGFTYVVNIDLIATYVRQ
jgi:hypothetical protein